jgi:hypothetical protein
MTENRIHLVEVRKKQSKASDKASDKASEKAGYTAENDNKSNEQDYRTSGGSFYSSLARQERWCRAERTVPPRDLRSRGPQQQCLPAQPRLFCLAACASTAISLHFLRYSYSGLFCLEGPICGVLMPSF